MKILMGIMRKFATDKIIKNCILLTLLLFSCNFLKAQKLNVSGIYINRGFQNISLIFELLANKWGNYSCYYQSYFRIYPKAPQSLGLYRNNEFFKKILFGYGISMWNKINPESKQIFYLTPSLKLSWENEIFPKIKIRAELFENVFVNSLNHQVYVHPVIYQATNKLNFGIKLGALYSHTYDFKSVYRSAILNGNLGYSF